jgi:hypothetical protein
MMLSCEPSPDMLILSVGLSMALMPHRIYRASGFVYARDGVPFAG